MRFKIQNRYDDLFPENWRSPLQSRRDLMLWACERHNEYMTEKGAKEEKLEDCGNYGGLLRKYGPNYDKLKHKLGHVKGLFENE